MKNSIKSVLLAAALVILPVTAQAQPGERDIVKFCDKGDLTLPPAPGKQHDDNPADAVIMLAAPGEYELNAEAGAALHLYEEGRFILFLGNDGHQTFGTDGDDMLGPRMVGGCSLEQLSEALKKNKLLDQAKAVIKTVPAE